MIHLISWAKHFTFILDDIIKLDNAAKRAAAKADWRAENRQHIVVSRPYVKQQRSRQQAEQQQQKHHSQRQLQQHRQQQHQRRGLQQAFRKQGQLNQQRGHYQRQQQQRNNRVNVNFVASRSSANNNGFSGNRNICGRGQIKR